VLVVVVVMGGEEGLTVEVGGERENVDRHGGRIVGCCRECVGLRSNPLMFVDLGGVFVVAVAVAGAIFGGADGRFYPADATTSVAWRGRPLLGRGFGGR
jgi:hypothetical protein